MRHFPLFFLSILLLSGIANAQTVTFSDLDLGGSKEILVYEASSINGQPVLIGTYNSTDSLQLNSSSDYLFVFEPGINHWYDNPFNAIELLNRETPSLLNFFVFFAVAVGIAKIIFR